MLDRDLCAPGRSLVSKVYRSGCENVAAEGGAGELRQLELSRVELGANDDLVECHRTECRCLRRGRQIRGDGPDIELECPSAALSFALAPGSSEGRAIEAIESEVETRLCSARRETQLRCPRPGDGHGARELPVQGLCYAGTCERLRQRGDVERAQRRGQAQRGG